MWKVTYWVKDIKTGKKTGVQVGSKLVEERKNLKLLLKALKGYVYEVIDLEKMNELKTAEDFYYAGVHSKQFDYKKGLDALIQKDKTDGKLIYFAGKDWKQFDYKRGLKVLKNTGYYKVALKIWPKGIEQSLEQSKEIAKTAKKLPMKKLKLEANMMWKVEYGRSRDNLNIIKLVDSRKKLRKLLYTIQEMGYKYKITPNYEIKEANTMDEKRYYEKKVRKLSKEIDSLSKSPSPSDKYKLEMLKAKRDKLMKKYKNLKEAVLVQFKDKEQWFENEEEAKVLTDKLDKEEIKYKVSKKERSDFDTGKLEIDNPNREVSDKQVSSDLLVGVVKEARDEYDGPRYVQVQNPKSKLWKKIDQKTGKIVAESKKMFRGVKIVSRIVRESKYDKQARKLNEFNIEIMKQSIGSAAKVNYNGKIVTFGELPNEVYRVVKFVISKLRPEERKKFYADDAGTFDIISKADGTLIVTDDEGNDYTKILKKRIKAAKL